MIQPDPLPSGEENGESVDKSALPDRGEMMDLLRGNCVILLLIVVNITLGILLIRYQHPRPLYIILSCLFAAALVVLGVVIFIFHCYRKEKIRLLWSKHRHCCKCRCLPGKKYEIQQESPEVDAVEEESPEDPASTPAADTANEDAGHLSGGEIHGAKKLLSLGDGDSLSNVSLPSSAAITLDKQLQVTLPEKEVEVQTEKASSVSDKQSWASAPLPLQYKRRGKLLKKPPGYRHSYTENEHLTSTIAECGRAPLAPPEGTASSVESSVQLPTDTASNIAPSEVPSSVHDAVEAPVNVSRNTNTSCSNSEVSIPIELPPMKKRPPIPGSSSQGSDGAPPLPFKKSGHPMSDTPVVSSPGVATQEFLDHYPTAEATTNSLPRHIPRDHVAVREKYHIPYEPRAVSEKPRDHYQIVPLPTNRRDHFLLQPGHDQYQDPRGQYLGQAAPEHYPVPGDNNTGQRTYDLNQVPRPTQARSYDYYRIPCDATPAQITHGLYQMARDLAPARLYDSYQAPHEQSSGQGQHDHSPGQKLHEHTQLTPDRTRISHDPGFSPRSPDQLHMSHDQVFGPRSPDHSRISHDPGFGPRSPDHSQISYDSSLGQRSHDHYQVPRDYTRRDQNPSERLYENIPVPSDHSSVQKPHERNSIPCNENELDPSQTVHVDSVTKDTAPGPSQEGAERQPDQYAGEGPREQPQAVNPAEKSTTADIRPGMPLDKNGVRSQNVPRGTREQPQGVRVSRRRSRNPYQIARAIHHNLGIETRPREGQTFRSKRVPGEKSSQPLKTFSKAAAPSTGETPKERTPRSSMSSWKEERPKPTQSDWASNVPKSAVFVPVPQLKSTTPEPLRNETSV